MFRLGVPRWIESSIEDRRVSKWLPLLIFLLLAVWVCVARVLNVGHPPVGTYVAILALVAGVMTIWPPENRRLKFTWAVIFAALLFLEISALYQQKRDDETQRDKNQMDENNRFAGLLKSQNESFEKVLEQNQREFDKTIENLSAISSRIEATAQEDFRQFSGVTNKEEALFDHEEELAEALRGKLIPGNDALPANNCGVLSHGAILLMLGNEAQHNAAVVSTFPHVVLMSRAHGPVVSLNRDGDKIAVILDMRSADGRIMTRLDSNGWVINRNNVLAANKDAHSLEVLDEYGTEVLSVRYINPQAISVSGREIGLPAGVSFACTAGARGADYSVP